MLNYYYYYYYYYYVCTFGDMFKIFMFVAFDIKDLDVF